MNQKGGVTKMTSCVNLAAGLAQAGKKVLVVDCDSQASLTISLGNPQPDRLPVTLSNIMGKVLNDEPITPGEGMLTEAEKYLGMPYVWGGSSPSTSFDCSGFVSWVVNHSGWSVGRLGAQGLCDICTPVSPANARPGDLVFFKYTYAAPNPDGVTHCGIYVGENMTIHCGNPISYANLNSNYWQEHFYCYGRLP